MDQSYGSCAQDQSNENMLYVQRTNPMETRCMLQRTCACTEDQSYGTAGGGGGGGCCWLVVRGGGRGGVLSHVYVYVHVCKLVCLCVYVYMGCGYVYMCAMLNGHGPSFTLFPASEEHEAFHFLVARQQGCLLWRLVELYMYMWSCADCTRSLALSLLSVKTILRRVVTVYDSLEK